jgi:hypothetical protein
MKHYHLLGLSLILALMGCSKLTLENYSKINVGTPYNDVVKLLGKPASCDDAMGIRSCEWTNGTASVHVNFVGGEALLFSSSNLK